MGFFFFFLGNVFVGGNVGVELCLHCREFRRVFLVGVVILVMIFLVVISVTLGGIDKLVFVGHEHEYSRFSAPVL